MKLQLIGWLVFWLGLAHAQSAADKSVLQVVPTLTELGEGWTTNVIAYLIDPLSEPSEIDYRGDAKTSLPLAYQRDAMQKNHRTGCGMLLYGRGDLVMNSGLFRVYIQRWADRRSLHNAWVGWKMDPTRVVPDTPAVGEDYFWTNDWWRQTRIRQNLAFRRGLFHVVVEAGAESDYTQMIQLAKAIDGKITGRAPAKPAIKPPIVP